MVKRGFECHDRIIFENLLIYHALDGCQLLSRHFLEMTEVKTETIGRNERTCLPHMGSYHFPQCPMQQMGRRMVPLNRFPATFIDGHPTIRSHEILTHNIPHPVQVNPIRINQGRLHRISRRGDRNGSRVTNLPSFFTIERGRIHHQIREPVPCANRQQFRAERFPIRWFIPRKTGGLHAFTAANRYHRLLLRRTRLRPLLLHVNLKSSLVNRQPAFTRQKLSQIQRETIGVIQRKSLKPANRSRRGHLFKLRKTTIESPLKCGFLTRKHLPQQLLTLNELREHASEGLEHRIHKLHKTPGFQIQAPPPQHRAPQNPAKHVVAPFVPRQNAVRNSTAKTTRMICQHPESNILQLHGCRALRIGRQRAFITVAA
ncbi:MAG: hypothetical protein BWY82_00661 [Verrucomicrobia bacterium ADurb.Bin474]|nr:MAG: hypothetical protein BWY82_00661 [Verrucomicrobia bacterium ADurb.Bin474]